MNRKGCEVVKQTSQVSLLGLTGVLTRWSSYAFNVHCNYTDQPTKHLYARMLTAARKSAIPGRDTCPAVKVSIGMPLFPSSDIRSMTRVIIGCLRAGVRMILPRANLHAIGTLSSSHLNVYRCAARAFVSLDNARSRTLVLMVQRISATCLCEEQPPATPSFRHGWRHGHDWGGQ